MRGRGNYGIMSPEMTGDTLVILTQSTEPPQCGLHEERTLAAVSQYL